MRANFRNFFNLHLKLDISCFCTQLIMPFLHFLTLNFNEIIKYKMFSSDLSWKKGQKLFSTKYVNPYPKPLCGPALLYSTLELMERTVSLGISERGVFSCSTNFSSLHFSTSAIFFSKAANCFSLKSPSSIVLSLRFC